MSGAPPLCNLCHGTGKMAVSVENPCQFCYGTGTKDVGSEGQFTVPCDICNGSGIKIEVRLVTCNQCGGTGELKAW